MTPASHQAIAACDKLHCPVLRDYDRKALRKIPAESISRAVAGSGVFGRLWNRNLRFQIWKRRLRFQSLPNTPEPATARLIDSAGIFRSALRS